MRRNAQRDARSTAAFPYFRTNTEPSRLPAACLPVCLSVFLTVRSFPHKFKIRGKIFLEPATKIIPYTVNPTLS